MPKKPEHGRNCFAKEPLPEEKSGHEPQVIAQPKIAPADAEEGMEPAKQDAKTDAELAQSRESAAQGAEEIHRRAQGHAPEKAAQEPADNEPRRHPRNPRLRRGSPY